MGLSQRLSRAVMVCLIPEKVLSEAEVKSWIADTQAWLRRWPTLRAPEALPGRSLLGSPS
jgi:hypothetical protein